MTIKYSSQRHFWRTCGFAALPILLSACAAMEHRSPIVVVDDGRPEQAFVRLPLHAGWYDGQRVFYITTDVSDKDAAKEDGANYVPRLANAVPELPQVPGQRSVVERIYGVTNFHQNKILPSAPVPAGHGSADKAYSPLWHMYRVTWLSGATPRILRSEEEVLDAEDHGLVSITRTDLVVNCPVIFSKKGGVLPSAKLVGTAR